MQNYDVNKMYEWPLTARIIVMALVFLIVLFLGYYLDITAKLLQIRLAREHTNNFKQQLSSIVNQQVEMKANILQLPILEKVLVQWRSKIVAKAALPGLLDQLLKISHDGALKINTFDPGVEVKANQYYKTPVKISMTGTYNDIATYMSKIVNMPNMVVIEKFVMAKDDAARSDNIGLGSSSDMFTADLVINIYRK